MEHSNRKIIFIAIFFSLITSILIFVYLSKIELSNKKIEYNDVFVATRLIEPKTVISAQDIKQIKIEKTLVNKDAILNKLDILNKTTKDTIYEGEQILKARLASKDNSSLAYQIPDGKRAITINVNEASAVGYFANPGDFVDVITTIEDNNQAIPATSKTILQNVLVLGMGQEKDIIDKVEGKTQKKDLKNTTSNENTTTKTVTIAVTPEDAEKIAVSEQAGTLRLTLRRIGDESITKPSGVNKFDLIK